ncbi:MAG: hypothetical protein AAB675_03415 [Patescibacteria group bacterium]
MVQIWLGFILLIAGVWFFISPKSAFEFRKKMVEMLGGKITGSKKLTGAYKWVGIALFAIGVILLIS